MRRDQGIALVVVLWVAMLLAGIAGAFVLETKAELAVARNNNDRAVARVLADGGIFIAADGLARPAEEQSFIADGRVHPLAIGGGRLEIAVEDEGGKIDLNAAPGALIKNLLASLGVDDRDADSLTDAILDWRDPDDLARLNGAEDEAYRAAGRDHGPRNGAMPAIEDLANVLGVTPRLMERLTPHVTVHAGQARVRIETASAEVLGAIPGTDPEIIARWIEARGTDLADGALDALLASGEVRRYRANRPTRAYTVRVRAVGANGAGFVREALVQLSRRAGGDGLIVSRWREGTRRGFDAGTRADSERIQ